MVPDVLVVKSTTEIMNTYEKSNDEEEVNSLFHIDIDANKETSQFEYSINLKY